MFSFLKARASRKLAAKKLYDTAVMQARQPVFYTDFGVPDTMDGRFDMIVLHVAIIETVLKQDHSRIKYAAKLTQDMFDITFRTMEQSLRQIGVGDLSVPKHMKRMMHGFHGRSTNYQKALLTDDKAMMTDSLSRNVYGTAPEIDPEKMAQLNEYVWRSYNEMKTQNLEEIYQGTVVFCPVNANVKEKEENANEQKIPA